MIFSGSIEEKAEQAQQMLAAVAPGAFCVAQEWDDRIDCLIKMPDGSVVGEMISLSSMTEVRIKEAGVRLKQKHAGFDVKLIDELWAPVFLFKAGKPVND